MRTLCDSCESAAAIVFCAADEAALCPACDEKVCFFTIWLLIFYSNQLADSYVKAQNLGERELLVYK